MYALQTGQMADGNASFEKFFGRKPNTVKSNEVERNKIVSETESKLTFSPSDFEEEIDSATLVRKRKKGSKLEGPYARTVGKVLKETVHTITFLPNKNKKKIVLSKRDVAKDTTERALTSKQVEITQMSND